MKKYILLISLNICYTFPHLLTHTYSGSSSVLDALFTHNDQFIFFITTHKFKLLKDMLLMTVTVTITKLYKGSNTNLEIS
jgi:hypothetical protein